MQPLRLTLPRHAPTLTFCKPKGRIEPPEDFICGDKCPEIGKTKSFNVEADHFGRTLLKHRIEGMLTWFRVREMFGHSVYEF